MKLYCMDERCKHCNDDNECIAERVELSFEGLNTVHQGFREVLSCKKFEKSDLCNHVEEFMSSRDLYAGSDSGRNEKTSNVNYKEQLKEILKAARKESEGCIVYGNSKITGKILILSERRLREIAELVKNMNVVINCMGRTK